VNPRWALFISGRGSNAQAVFDLMSEARVSVVVSSKSDVWGLVRARRMGVPTLVLNKSIDWTALDLELKKRQIQRVLLLGFMRMIPAEFVEKWKGRMWNLHPSLLPAYPGMAAIEKSFEAGGSMGVTVHEVTAEMDSGKRILQARSIQNPRPQDMAINEAQIFISRDEQRLVRRLVERRSQWSH
jgi:phosphoribosylglycinamide formyltransferase-1